MSKSPFALLWGKILDSSVWALDDEIRLVWITMLALKDIEGKVKASVPGLANRARVSLEGCQRALEVFKSPDKFSQSVAREGRRIAVIPGGWQILNHEEYRFASEAKRAFWREMKQQQRDKKNKVGAYIPNAAQQASAKLEQQGKPEAAERALELDTDINQAALENSEPESEEPDPQDYGRE